MSNSSGFQFPADLSPLNFSAGFLCAEQARGQIQILVEFAADTPFLAHTCYPEKMKAQNPTIIFSEQPVH